MLLLPVEWDLSRPPTAVKFIRDFRFSMGFFAFSPQPSTARAIFLSSHRFRKSTGLHSEGPPVMLNAFTVSARVEKCPSRREYSKNLVPDHVGLSSGVESENVAPLPVPYWLLTHHSQAVMLKNTLKGMNWGTFGGETKRHLAFSFYCWRADAHPHVCLASARVM